MTLGVDKAHADSHTACNQARLLQCEAVRSVMERPLKAVAKLMTDVIETCLQWRDDGALSPLHIPKSTRHRLRIETDGHTRDARAKLVAIWPNGVLDLDRTHDPSFFCQRYKSTAINTRWPKAQN
jgi:hypothetical protein